MAVYNGYDPLQGAMYGMMGGSIARAGYGKLQQVAPRLTGTIEGYAQGFAQGSMGYLNRQAFGTAFSIGATGKVIGGAIKAGHQAGVAVVQSGGSVTAQTAAPSKAIHKNSLDYVGDTHVYRVKGSDGTTFKIGESAQGVRVKDGASIRGEQQARQLTRDTGDFYQSEIRRTFPDKRSAREYETRLIERFRCR